MKAGECVRGAGRVSAGCGGQGRHKREERVKTQTVLIFSAPSEINTGESPTEMEIGQVQTIHTSTTQKDVLYPRRET